MLKLLKNEWKRYSVFSIAMAAASVIAGLLLIIIMLVISVNKDMDSNSEILAAGNVIIVVLIIYCIPYAAVIYGILSYATDIGRKGMIFLTPVPTWKIILSKLIYTSALFALLYVISRGSIIISGLIETSYDISKNLNLFSYFNVFKIDDTLLNTIFSTMQSFISALHMVLMIMASISLARFSANSVGVQVFLSILFYIAISTIESLITFLISKMFSDFDSFYEFSNYLILTSWIEFFVSIIASIALYIITVCLTDKKVNLVS